MDQIIAQLQEKYGDQIQSADRITSTELNLKLNADVALDEFSQQLKDHLLEMVDDLTILKINVIAADGDIVSSFATNQ